MKLENCFETETVEFKSTLAELDKGIVSLTAMLNKSGTGTVYFGVRNDGEIRYRLQENVRHGKENRDKDS